MTNILLEIERIAIIFKTKNFFWFFQSISGIYIKFERFWKKKMIVIATLLRKLKALKDFVRPLSKNAIFEHPLRLDMLKDPKLL